MTKWRLSMAATAIAALFVGTGGCRPVTAAEKTLKYAHIYSPEHSIHIAGLHFAKLVAEKSGGKIEIQVLPSEQLGTERQLVEGMTIGSVDMSPITANVLSSFEPSVGITSLPYLVRDFDHAFKIEDGEIGKELASRLLKKLKLHAIGYTVTGFRAIATRDRPIKGIEDFKGLKIRVPEAPVMVQTFKALNANPTPVPWGEVYTALQTKLVDAAESPPGTMDSAKLFEVTNHLAITNHIYTDQFFLMSDKAWNSLSPAERASVLEAAKETTEFDREYTKREQANTVESVKKRGIAVTEVDTEPLRKAMKPIYDNFAKSCPCEQFIDAALKM